MNKSGVLIDADVSNVIDKSYEFSKRQLENLSTKDLVETIMSTNYIVKQLYSQEHANDAKDEILATEEDCKKELSMLKENLISMRSDEDQYIKEISKLKSQIVFCENNEGELERMKIKSNIAIPKVTIVYIIFSSMSISFFAINLFLTIFRDINIIHPFTSLLSLVGSIGLLVTSLVSIKDWREFLKNE